MIYYEQFDALSSEKKHSPDVQFVRAWFNCKFMYALPFQNSMLFVHVSHPLSLFDSLHLCLLAVYYFAEMFFCLHLNWIISITVVNQRQFSSIS